MEQNLYRNFTAHLTALQKLNIVGADTFLRNILTVTFKVLFLNIFLNENQHNKDLHVTLKMSRSAFSQLQKIMGSLALPDMESIWQNIWR